MKKIIAIAGICLIVTGFILYKNRAVPRIEGKDLFDEAVLRDQNIDDEIRRQLKENEYDIQNPFITQNPYGLSPLTAIVAFSTQKKTQIKMSVRGDTKQDTLTYQFPETKNHIIPIVGLYPGRTNYITLEQIANGITVDTKTITLTTPSLPDHLKNKVTTGTTDGKAVDGMTIVSGFRNKTPFAFDSSGNIRWYLNVEVGGQGYFPLSNNKFMLMHGSSTIETPAAKYPTIFYEMDFLGRHYTSYRVAQGVHHEILEKIPNGNLIILSNTLDGHAEDLVIEVDRETGKIVRELNLNTILQHPVYNEPYDWAHLNSISYNPKDDSVILSVRNVSSSIKISWETKTIEWIMGDPETWKDTEYEKYVLTPAGDLYWPYEHHAVHEVSTDLDGNPDTIDIILFDNRVRKNDVLKRSVAEDPDRSAVSQYAINKKDKTVQQVKRFPNLKSHITSNWQLFYEQDRILANHATINENDQYRGEIYEYEYSTGKLIRSYIVKNGFYRAYRQPLYTISSLTSL